MVSLGSVVLAYLTLLAVNWLEAGRPLAWLGLGGRGVWPGVKQAAVALVMLLPIVYAAALTTNGVRHVLGLPNDEKHPLIEQLGKNENGLTIGLTALAASVMAPLFEELLFRGHLQTAIGYTLARWADRRRAETRGFEPILAGVTADVQPVPQTALAPPDPFRRPATPPPLPGRWGEAVPAYINYQPAPVAGAADPPDPAAAWPARLLDSTADRPADAYAPRAAVRWAAIVLTSLLFAAVHPPFSIPIIFVLAVGLGYLYERTGNLWAPIFVHAAFNSISLILFLVALTLGLQ